jgi:hypothetical protein
MNVNRKTLILAIAAGMGIIPVAGVFAATPSPLGKTPGGSTVVGPVYSPAESKENSVAYNISYDNTAVVTSGLASSTVANAAAISNGGDLNAYIYTMPGYSVKAAETKSLQVKVTLTGGAKFVKAPSLICMHSGAAGGDASIALGVASAGATWNILAELPATNVALAGATTLYRLPSTNTTQGLASYNFYFPEGFAVSNGGSGACLLSVSTGGAPMALTINTDLAFNSALTLPANASDVSLNVDVTYDDFFTKVIKSTAISMISFVTAYGTTFTKAEESITIDVGALSKKFLLGSTTEYGGHVIVGPTKDSLGNFRTLRNATGFTLSATDILSGASVTISGPTVATLSKVMLSSGGVVSGCANMILEGAPAAVSGGASDSVTIAIPNGSQSYQSLVSGTLANGVAGGHNGLNLCLVAEGNTKVMMDGYVTITVNGTTPVGKVVELGSSAADFLRVKRNGTVVRVLNVPGDAADPYRVNIRMYNTSSQTVNNIMGTLYGVDGKLIADNLNLAPSLAPNNVKLITSDSLVTLVGKTWTGRAWMIIQAPVDSSGFKVQVLVKQPSGVLGNISTDATD